MIESGQQFGLYEIKEVYSTGATHTFCRAEDPFFNREVVISIYPDEQFQAGEQLGQLESLLENLSVLDHQSIAPIYDSGRENGYFYYTSACYPAGNLAEKLTTSLPAEQALKVLVELAQALDYALENEIGQGKLSTDKIYFDDDGRAVLVDFGIDLGLAKILGSEHDNDSVEASGSVAATLHSVGDLLLQMVLGSAYNIDERIDDQVAKIGNTKIRQLVGRFLLPGEWRFASYAELLEDLAGHDEVAEILRKEPEIRGVDDTDNSNVQQRGDLSVDDQTDKMIAEVRRLVAEKNGLQQSLDKALYERTLAGNKLAEGERQLGQITQEITKAREEANVAWELVAGQKYDRWRPVIWAVGGFAIGFLLSGSYGYYYSEQTRNELLAKLKANEELIKTAAWRPAEQGNSQPQVVVAEPRQETVAEEIKSAGNSPAVEQAANVPEGLVTEAEAEAEARLAETIEVTPVAEETQHWWPAGSEFSVTAAIPVEQIKAALGIEGKTGQGEFSDMLHQEIMATVQHWADSWASQDLSSYFSAYSENYRPELGRSQQEWREMRRFRVSRPQWIKLDINDIRVRKVSEDRVQVKIKQSYRSDFYQDDILKSINLIREDGQWRILMERSLGMIADSDIVGG
jgi:hypothetical protein